RLDGDRQRAATLRPFDQDIIDPLVFILAASPAKEAESAGGRESVVGQLEAVVEDPLAIGQVKFSVLIDAEQNGAKTGAGFQFRFGHLSRGNQRALIAD